jgi:hypothetical protein
LATNNQGSPLHLNHPLEEALSEVPVVLQETQQAAQHQMRPVIASSTPIGRKLRTTRLESVTSRSYRRSSTTCKGVQESLRTISLASRETTRIESVISKRPFRSCRAILNRIRNRSRTARMRGFQSMSRLSR